ncbi:hypothetical protein B0O99DRAFT_745891 [Bisporella sp. PMI_857]|nr:hypothetical protein B0O99DRAFT_745891 [Bisporella sp. PMI_857]
MTSEPMVNTRKDAAAPQARKDRKRATDRLAQREHRRRQKMYVEDLENQLRVLKHESTTNPNSTLLEENERLRNEAKLKALLSAVENIVQGFQKLSLMNDGSAQSIETPVSLSKENESDESRAAGVCSTPRAQDNMSLDICLDNSSGRRTAVEEVRQDMCDVEPQLISTFEADTDLDLNLYSPIYQAPANPSELAENSNISASAVWGWWGINAPNQEQSASTGYESSSVPTWLNTFFALGSLSPSSQLHDLSNPSEHEDFIRQDQQNNAHFPQSQGLQAISPSADMTISNIAEMDTPDMPLVSTSRCLDTSMTSQPQEPTTKSHSSGKSSISFDINRSRFELQRHRTLSHVLMPPMPEDMYVHEIIERARSNTLSRRMLLDAPTLADFLIDNPTNVLSADLKRYLEPVRRLRRMDEYLGTYWVSYLLLRWQVNQSAESFERIPTWFRPTDLQMHVAHPIAIDFIAWPLLRDQIVKLSQTSPEKVHDVMTTVGVYLELDLGASIGNNPTNEEVLHSVVCDLKNWKLKEGFFEIYPQWRGMCELPSDIET